MKKVMTFCAAVLFVGSVSSQELFELDKNLHTELKPSIETSMSSSKLSFRVLGKSQGGTVTITGPNGYNSTQKFIGSSNTIDVYDSEAMASMDYGLPSGRYFYRISTHYGASRLIKDTINNGRDDKSYTYAGEPLIYTGDFVVSNGVIQSFKEITENEYETF